ncbi:MAG: S41 family peptidase, partial [Bacteriovoracaceae bacterium]|nr:S41 family peptidase [Bacteriovoracaceae bacterium]
NDGILNFELTREIIQIKPVKFDLIQNQYAYLRLVQFQKKSGQYMIDALKKLETEAKKFGGLKGIVIDLRSNPGGLLDEAVEVSSIFLKEGVVVSTEGRDPKQKEVRYVKKTGYKELNLPVVVLINGSTASASEIVAGALQDHKRALVMGSQSFGKGSVQSVAKIDDEKGVKLTIAQYMTPSNKKIQAIGIKPDIAIEETEGAWVLDNRKESSIVREKDLRNHLTATVETAEEKVEREAFEKADREKRELRLKELREAKNKLKTAVKDQNSENSESDEVKGTPQNDYQVLQAVNYLNSIGIIKNLKLEK